MSQNDLVYLEALKASEAIEAPEIYHCQLLEFYQGKGNRILTKAKAIKLIKIIKGYSMISVFEILKAV